MVDRPLLDEQFVNDAGFAPVGVVAGRPLRRDANFRRTVSAEHRPIVHETDAGSLPRGGDGGAKTRQSPAAYDDIIRFFHRMDDGLPLSRRIHRAASLL